MTHAPLLLWWLSIGTALYLLCLYLTLRLPLPKAYYAARPPLVIALYTMIPLLVKLAEDDVRWPIIALVCLLMALLGVLPMHLYDRRQAKTRDKEHQNTS